MSNTERKDMKVERLVISCISKSNNINKTNERCCINVISTVFSPFFSTAPRNAETTSRCPHCRSSTIFFSSSSSSPLYIC
jgi:hypothetical protein